MTMDVPESWLNAAFLRRATVSHHPEEFGCRASKAGQLLQETGYYVPFGGGNAWSKAASPSKTTEYTRTGDEEMKNGEVGPRDSGSACIANSDEIPKAFVGFIQILADKTERTLNSTASVVYPVHAIVLNVNARRVCCSIGNSHTLILLLETCFTQEQL